MRGRRGAGPALWLLLAAAMGAAPAAAQPRPAPHPLAARTVVLANSEDPDSLRIAQHYLEARGVPAANLVALKMPLAETIGWREFIATIWQPLLDRLVPAGWVDAVPMNATDALGRKKYAPYAHRIAALVVCRGVPLRIEHAPEFFAEVIPLTARGEFRTNAGAVDSELSLLALPNYAINAFVPNPLFNNERPTTFELGQVVKVGRLDGPTVGEANALVDRALEAERTGLLGRAYVDIANRDNLGDPWLEAAAKQLAELGYDTAVDRDNATMPEAARIDAPAFYFGWYTGGVGGPFLLPGFRFPPGAIALHIHSFSASTLRQTNGGWAGPFVARGVTATFGNVHEPYLQFTHQPHLFLRALARGATLAEAAYFSINALSWMGVLIGDPLYRPFLVPLEAQLERPDRLPPRLAGYAVLRKMRRLEAERRPEEATALAIAAQRQSPSLAVAVALARRLRDGGDHDGAGNALGLAPLLTQFEADEWALAREAAMLLGECGRAGRALVVWRTLLATPTLPAGLKIAWLPDAAAAARAARNPEQSLAWQRELAELTAPAEKK